MAEIEHDEWSQTLIPPSLLFVDLPPMGVLPPNRPIGPPSRPFRKPPDGGTLFGIPFIGAAVEQKNKTQCQASNTSHFCLSIDPYPQCKHKPVLSIFFAKDLILMGMVNVVLFFLRLFAASAAVSNEKIFVHVFNFLERNKRQKSQDRNLHF